MTSCVANYESSRYFVVYQQQILTAHPALLDHIEIMRPILVTARGLDEKFSY